jgi:hypothetical protein
MAGKQNHDPASLHKIALLKARIVKYALLWCGEPEAVDAYDSMRGTNSASAPGSFLCLYESCEELKKARAR